MTPEQARTWIIKYTIVLYVAFSIFFLLAPAVGYPLSYPDSINILKILLPMLLGYIGAAAHFILRPVLQDDDELPESRKRMLSIIVRWPLIGFLLIMVAILFAFWQSNKGQNFTGEGMTPNTLSLIVSIICGLLAATTGAASSYLFQAERTAGRSPSSRPRSRT